MGTQNGYIALEASSLAGPSVVLVAVSYSALMAGTAELNKVQQYEFARHSILGITIDAFCTAVAISFDCAMHICMPT